MSDRDAGSGGNLPTKRINRLHCSRLSNEAESVMKNITFSADEKLIA